MSETTGIAWTDHTFNPWWGCVEVSPACDNCYARTDAKRYGHAVWGKDAPRRYFGEKHWNEPVRWNKKAAADGFRRRVFCASMADVFEDRPGDTQLEAERARLWDLIAATPALDWLLLTKRPGNIERFGHRVLSLGNVWLGTTVEDRTHGLPRVNVLRTVAHRGIKFLSVEPLIEDLGDVNLFGIHWAIVGGESGPHARPFKPEWARTLIAQCRAAEVAPFIKQMGSVVLVPACRQTHWDYRGQFEGKPGFAEYPGDPTSWRWLLPKKGDDPSAWPEWLRVREFPVRTEAPTA